MGILEEGVFGPFSGAVNNLVGVKGKNGNYIRKKPRKSTIPRSIGQVTQSHKMSLLTPLLRNIKPFLDLSFKLKAIESRLSAYNAAKSACLLTGTKGIHPNQEINWEGIVVAQGDRAKPEKVTVEHLDDGFEIKWDQNFDIMNGSSYDRAMIYLYNVENKTAFYEADGARRSALKDFFEITNTYRGSTFQIYLAFKDIQTHEVSNSVYCGSHVF